MNTVEESEGEKRPRNRTQHTLRHGGLPRGILEGEVGKKEGSITKIIVRG